ncbi:hypothetical protein SGPA1_60126 [Streptomyces misionensis JCM 4497]
MSYVPPLGTTFTALPAATAYQALLPLSAPPELVDDVIAISRSQRDGQLVGRRLRGVEVAVGTYAVVRDARPR